MSEYTTDYLQNKQIKIFQPTNGYRASIDAVILSAMIKNVSPKENILDIGSGTGAISLCLAHRFGQSSITGLEIQPQLVELSNQSAKANGFNNLNYINCDISKKLSDISNCSFDHVITNPPYSDHDMPSPNPSKALAHNHHNFNLTKWISFAIKMTKPKGYLYTINRSEALEETISALYKKMGNIVVVPLFSKDGQNAKRVLISARKNSKTPSTITSGIITHNQQGYYSPQMEQILKHSKSIWDIA